MQFAFATSGFINCLDYFYSLAAHFICLSCTVQTEYMLAWNLQNRSFLNKFSWVFFSTTIYVENMLIWFFLRQIILINVNQGRKHACDCLKCSKRLTVCIDILSINMFLYIFFIFLFKMISISYQPAYNNFNKTKTLNTSVYTKQNF